MEYNFTIDSVDAGKRIDLFLASKINEFSRSYIQRLITEEKILLNGSRVSAHHKISCGDKVSASFLKIQKTAVLAEDIKLKIIFEDEDILIINKPSGMVVHPAAGNKTGTLVSALLNYTKNLSTVSPERPGIVHRLDKETSGVMVVAKNNPAHLALIKQFASGRVEKKYIAIVQGIVEFDEGVIDLSIARHSRNFRLLQVSFHDDSKLAVTKYKVLKRFKGSTLVELRPQTGRTHQLRVHLKHLGHPILGDAKYGKKESWPRMALHAEEVTFAHPRVGKRVTFSAEIPDEFNNYKE